MERRTHRRPPRRPPPVAVPVTRADRCEAPPKARILFYGDDPVALFFLHIQGSGRVWLDDGTILRVNYAGQNGQPYTPIGRTLIHDTACRATACRCRSSAPG